MTVILLIIFIIVTDVTDYFYFYIGYSMDYHTPHAKKIGYIGYIGYKFLERQFLIERLLCSGIRLQAVSRLDVKADHRFVVAIDAVEEFLAVGLFAGDAGV